MGCDIHILLQINKEGVWTEISETPESFKTRDYSVFAYLANIRNYFLSEHFEPKGLPEGFEKKEYCFTDTTDKTLENYYHRTLEMAHMPDGKIVKVHDKRFAIQCDSKEEARTHSNYSIVTGRPPVYYDPSAFGAVVMDTPVSSFMDFKEYTESCEWGTWIGDRFGFYTVDFSSPDYHSHSWLTLAELESKDAPNYAFCYAKIPHNFRKQFERLGGIFPPGMTLVNKKNMHYQDISSIIMDAFQPDDIIRWPMTDEQKKETNIYKGICEFGEIAAKYGVSSENIRMVFAFDN